MTHVDMSVKSYLGSLKKLHSGNDNNGKPDFILDNELGLPEPFVKAVQTERHNQPGCYSATTLLKGMFFRISSS